MPDVMKSIRGSGLCKSKGMNLLVTTCVLAVLTLHDLFHSSRSEPSLPDFSSCSNVAPALLMSTSNLPLSWDEIVSKAAWIDASSSMSIWTGVTEFVDVGNSSLTVSIALWALARDREPRRI